MVNTPPVPIVNTLCSLGGGIVKMKPCDVEQTYGITPHRIHHLGTTGASQRDFERYLLSIQTNFTRECYDLVKWNCNNFTDHASRFLVERGIPAYILDLPDEITNTFMGKIIINSIKMFSDAPAIDSESATHPKQTLSAPLSSVRRNSCPGSPTRNQSILGGTSVGRLKTNREPLTFNSARRKRTVSGTRHEDKREERWNRRASSASTRDYRLYSNEDAKFRKGSVPSLAVDQINDSASSTPKGRLASGIIMIFVLIFITFFVGKISSLFLLYLFKLISIFSVSQLSSSSRRRGSLPPLPAANRKNGLAEARDFQISRVD